MAAVATTILTFFNVADFLPPNGVTITYQQPPARLSTPPATFTVVSDYADLSEFQQTAIGYTINANPQLQISTRTVTGAATGLDVAPWISVTGTPVQVTTLSVISQPVETPSDQPSGTASPEERTGNSTSATSISPTGTSLGADNESGSNDNTGLIAAVGVLAGLLVLAILIFSFLLWRQRRRSRRHPVNHIAYTDKVSVGKADLPAGYGETSELADTAAARSGAALVGIDDKSVFNKFSQLDASIKNWVVANFRAGASLGAPSLAPDTVAILNHVSGSWEELLASDQKTRFLLIRGIVASMLSSAWAEGSLLGDDSVNHLNKRFGQEGHTAGLALWRSQTIGLLQSNPSYAGDRQASLEQLTSSIDAICSAVIPPENDTAGTTPVGSRISKLHQIVTSASDIALELDRQKVDFEWKWLKGDGRVSLSVGMASIAPRTTFDGQNMDDVLQERKARQLEGREVKARVFPGVWKWGNEEGGGWNSPTRIMKEMVLVS